MRQILQITLLVLAGFLVSTTAAITETADELRARLAASAEEMKNAPAGTSVSGNMLDQLIAQPSQSEAETAARQEFATAVFAYRAFAENHKTAVFEWQIFSSKVIFWMVMLIVFIGLYFSWTQFHAAKDPNTMKSTTLKLGKGGVEVTSPILGVIILVLSLAFLYLYLVHVYKITAI